MRKTFASAETPHRGWVTGHTGSSPAMCDVENLDVPSHYNDREVNVRKLTLAAGIAAFVITGACKKTGEGEYEVQKPVVGTTTDTVETPSVETGTVKDTISVPTVGTEKKEVNMPKVDVKTPDERK